MSPADDRLRCVRRAIMRKDGRMSNLGPGGQGQARLPMPPRGEPIARYDTYLEAQRAVDFLSDHSFPVQNVTIVGTGLRMVERVTGRLTYGRAALAGAGSGFYLGLFVGLLLSLFGGQGNALVAAPLFGVAFGVLFGVISYAATRGRRDFTSTSQIVASEYEVLCLSEQAGAARTMPAGRLLGRDATGRLEWSVRFLFRRTGAAGSCRAGPHLRRGDRTATPGASGARTPRTREPQLLTITLRCPIGVTSGHPSNK